jgi:hypothetical protein
MVRRTAVTVALVGLVMVLSSGTATATEASCFLCLCDKDSTLIPTACSNSDVTHIVCPECPTGSLPAPPRGLDTPCNEAPECGPFLSRAPALSPIPLAGLGVLLVGGGIWIARKRTRAAA